MSNFHFNFSVTRAIFIKAINVSEALAFLQGANYHILPSDKSNNHAATIRAILSLQYPEITIDRVLAALDNKDPQCLAKDLQIIRNAVKAFRFMIDSLNTGEKSIDVFLQVNKILQLETTVFSGLSKTKFQRLRLQDLEAIFKAVVENEEVHPYMRAATVFKEYSDKKFFNEANELTWLFLCLYILFRDISNPCLADFDLQNLVSVIIRNKSEPLDGFLSVMLDEIYNVSYPVALEILHKREAAKPDTVTSQAQRLLSAMTDGNPMSSRELMVKLKLTDISSFRKRYLTPAVKSALVERSLPDHPSSPVQTYILTEKGREFLETSDIHPG